MNDSTHAGREIDASLSARSTPVRILWPALGFPATIAPRSDASGSPFKTSDATRCITLLVLTARQAPSPAEVARGLRYVAWPDRGRRQLAAGNASSFPESEIEVLGETSKSLFALPNSKDQFGELITFGGDADGERGITATLANRVRDFYRAAGLGYLSEIRISERASSRLANGFYHLFWNNSAPGENAPSDEMALLVAQFARPRRAKLGELWRRESSFLLDEYQYEYRPMHSVERRRCERQAKRDSASVAGGSHENGAASRGTSYRHTPFSSGGCLSPKSAAGPEQSCLQQLEYELRPELRGDQAG